MRSFIYALLIAALPATFAQSPPSANDPEGPPTSDQPPYVYKSLEDDDQKCVDKALAALECVYEVDIMDMLTDFGDIEKVCQGNCLLLFENDWYENNCNDDIVWAAVRNACEEDGVYCDAESAMGPPAMYEAVCLCGDGGCGGAEDEWEEWYGDVWEEYNDWYDEDCDFWALEWGEECPPDGELDCPANSLQQTIAVMDCLAKSYDQQTESFSCDRECQTRKFLSHPECFIEAEQQWDLGVETMMEAVLYYHRECISRNEETDFDVDCVEGSKDTITTQLIMVDKNMHCPSGFGFPTSGEQCKNAILASNRITSDELKDEFDFAIFKGSGNDPTDGRPRCFWHGDGYTADKGQAGYFESPRVSCAWDDTGRDRDVWEGYGAVCIKCGGCFGDCWDCGDDMHLDNSDNNGYAYDGRGEMRGDDGSGVIALFLLLLFIVVMFGMCIYCYKNTKANQNRIVMAPQGFEQNRLSRPR